MKTKTSVSILIIIFATLIIFESCATNKQAVKHTVYEIDVLHGTWVNPDYQMKFTDTGVPIYFGTISILNMSDEEGMEDAPLKQMNIFENKTTMPYFVDCIGKWPDENGAINYKLKITYTDLDKGLIVLFSGLLRQSPDKTFIEFNLSSGEEYPTQINKSGDLYHIYYRQ